MVKKRIISGALLVVVALVLIQTGGVVLLAAGTVIGCIAYRELLTACSAAGDGKYSRALEYAGYLMIILWHVIIYFKINARSALVWLAVSLMLFLIIYVLTFPSFRDTQVMSSFFCLLYGPFLLSFVSLTRGAQMGDVTVWLIFISASVCDVGAYAVGVLLGKHKMAPVLSPKKTVEGAVGGVVAAAAGGLLYALWVVFRGSADQSVLYVFPIFCALCSVFSMVGDLAASAIKRDHIIKDYGNLIPGHGGVMDRFDSVLFTAPLTWMLTIYINGGTK
ncbi:MAG: phosphatidate cytidylyltransferase [Lachnospiraceae bacterium]|nr:phosphatidate cytidylyltransferase [Lachnospiraceae bacterium]